MLTKDNDMYLHWYGPLKGDFTHKINQENKPSKIINNSLIQKTDIFHISVKWEVKKNKKTKIPFTSTYKATAELSHQPP